MADDEKTPQPDNPEGATPGKVPGEGATPVEQDIDTSGSSRRGDTPDEAVGAGPSGGAETGGGTTGTSEATGAGPSGGADSGDTGGAGGGAEGAGGSGGAAP